MTDAKPERSATPGSPELRSASMLIVMVAVRIGCALVLFKILSVAFGPDRFGVITQIMGVAATIYMFAGGGISNGLIKFVSQGALASERRDWLTAALFISLASSIILLIVSLLLAYLTPVVFPGVPELRTILVVVSAAQFFVAIGNTALAFFSGSDRLHLVAFANTAGTIAAVVLAIILAATDNFTAAATGVALLPLGPALIATACLLRAAPAAPSYDRHRVTQLLRFSTSMVFAVIAIPVAQIYLRNQAAADFGWHEVGQWQAVAKISDAYMQVFGVLLANLLLPELTKSGSNSARRVILLIIGVFIFGATIYLTLRAPILQLAFSTEFQQAEIYVAPQLAGDFARVGFWIFVYLFLAANNVWMQAIADVAQAALSIALYLILAPHLGTSSLVLSHTFACTIVLAIIAVVYFFRRAFHREEKL